MKLQGQGEWGREGHEVDQTEDQRAEAKWKRSEKKVPGPKAGLEVDQEGTRKEGQGQDLHQT